MFSKRTSLLLLLASIGLVSGQFEAIEECITDEVLEEVVGCITAKFDALLDIDIMSRYTPEGESLYTGRRLLYTHADDAMRKNFMPQVLERMAKTHKGILSSLASVSHMVKNNMQDERLLAKLKHLNLKDFARNYLTQLSLSIIPAARTAGSYQRVMQTYANILVEEGKELPAAFNDNQEIIDLLCQIAGEEICDLLKMVQCLDGYDEAAFEDGLDWLECLFKCDDLIPLSFCVADVFNATDPCSEIDWMGDIIVRVFTDLVGLDTCYFKIESPEDFDPNNTLIVEEGAEPTTIAFRTYLPPSVLCVEPNILDNPLSLILDLIGFVFGLSEPCDVQIQMSTSMWMYDLLPYVKTNLGVLNINIGRPKCRSDEVIHQAAIGWFDEASNYSCTINVTDENWNTTFHVPVSAIVDHKKDGDIDINFTLKMTMDGETYNTTKVPLLIKDNDPEEVHVCQSVNDPHILTFDGHYYNNLYHGYFYMYKHETMPYEVQGIYQACSHNTTESCNCGIAVRSGDDVFVVDKCRRKPETCSGDDCQLMQVFMYTNGEITPGTRVFVKDGGLRYDVILPHGTVVKIMTSGDLLNAYILPSVYDRDHTTGLCGTFNEDETDELTMPDGSVYTGPGSEPQGQPRPFCKAWRVPEEERIFSGAEAAAEEFEPLKYCKCHHILFEGVECTCGHGDLIEYCDFDTDGELTENISTIVRKSAKTLALLQGRDFRVDDDDRDINEDYEPDEISFDGDWTEQAARDHCEALISPGLSNASPVIRRCRTKIKPQYEQNSKAIENCMDDIAITDGTTWDATHVEVSKQFCLNALNRYIDIAIDEWDFMENDTCLNNCYDRGECIRGVCECEPGYMGGDCSLSEQDPTMVMDRASLCDSRYEDCQYATIFGHNYDVSQDLMCVVQEYNVHEGSLQQSDASKEVSTIYINNNQVACRLPSATSYEVSLMSGNKVVESTDVLQRSSFIFMAYDSVCYECNTNEQTCTRKESKDHCLINGACFAPYEERPDDHCSICNVTVSTEEWTDRTTEECLDIRREEQDKRDADHRDMVIRASVSAGLSALIIIIAIILFVVDRRNQKKNKDKKDADDLKPEDGDVYMTSKTETNIDLGMGQTATEGEATEHYRKLDDSTMPNHTSTLEPTTHRTKEDQRSEVHTAAPQATTSQTETTPANAYDNPALNTEDEVFHDESASNPSTVQVSAECAEVLRVKAEIAAQGRARTLSMGSNASKHSISSFFRIKNLAMEQGRERTLSTSSGIGGVGPVAYGRLLPSVTDNEVTPEMHGIGGHGTPMSSPGGNRKDYHNVPIARF